MDGLTRLVETVLHEREWTPYRLHQEMGGEKSPVTLQTIYNFLAGKPVKAVTMLAIFQACGIQVSRKKGSK
jgi:hypothetical protein